MQARLDKSKKWTSFPPEFSDQVLKILNSTFSAHAKNGKFVIEGRIYEQEILLLLGYLEKGRLVQFNAEVSIEYQQPKDNVKNIIDLAIDSAGSVLDNYFENPKEDFPIEWKMFKLNKKEVFIKTSSVNTSLESEADKLLGLNSDSLVQGEDNELEIEAIKKVFEGED